MSARLGDRDGRGSNSRSLVGGRLTLRASLREHWRLWRWAIAAIVVALSIGIGVALYNSARIEHCRSHVDLGASTSAGECLAVGGNIYATGGNVWGVVIAMVGAFVFSWLVPLLIGRRLFPDRKLQRQQQTREGLAARERWRPERYGQQAELVWNTQSIDANTILARIAADGVYEVVSTSPATRGDPIWATNNRTIFHLRVKQYPRQSQAVTATTTGSSQEASRKIDIDREDAELLLSYCESGSTLEKPVITQENYRLFLNAQADAERNRRLRSIDKSD
jgi:hypothetical protein